MKFYQNYSLYSLHKVWSARCLVCKMFPFGPLQTGPWSTGLHGLVCRLYPTQNYSRTPVVATKVTSSVYHSSTHLWGRVYKVLKSIQDGGCGWNARPAYVQVTDVSSKCLVMRNMILFYVLVLIECIDRNWFKYWVLVNVTFFSAGLVLSLKCRFHGNYITDKKAAKGFCQYQYMIILFQQRSCDLFSVMLSRQSTKVATTGVPLIILVRMSLVATIVPTLVRVEVGHCTSSFVDTRILSLILQLTSQQTGSSHWFTSPKFRKK